MAEAGDDQGTGKFMAVLVFVASFMIVVVFLISSLAPILSSYDYSVSDAPTPMGFSATDMTTYTLYNNTYGGGYYNMTPAMYLNYVTLPDISFGGGVTYDGGWTNMTFLAPDEVIYFFPDKGTDPDTFKFWSHTGIFDSNRVYVSYNDILNNVKSVIGDNGERISRAEVKIELYRSYTVFFIFPTGVEPKASLDAQTGYLVYIGQSTIQQYASTGNNAWDYVTGILTFNLPGGGTGVQWFDVMLSMAVYAAILFIAYWAITRLLGAIIP